MSALARADDYQPRWVGRTSWRRTPPRAVVVVALAMVSAAAASLGFGAGYGGPVFGIVLSAYVPLRVLVFLRHRKALALVDTADRALAAGEVRSACDSYGQGAKLLEGDAPLHTAVLLQLSEARMQAGDFSGALELLDPLAKTNALRHDEELVREADIRAARCQVLLGDVAAARRIIERIEETTALVYTVELSVLCDLREGKPESALKTLRSNWESAEESLTGAQMKTLRMLEAFAKEQVHGEGYRSQSEAFEVRRVVDSLEPFRRGRWDGLATHWPELRRFLEAHSLSAPS